MRQSSSLGVVELALVAVGALLGVGAGRRGVTPAGLQPQELLQGGARPPEGVVGGHEAVVDERVHEDALLHDPPELRAFLGEVPVVVVADDDAVGVGGQPEDIAIVVAHHALAADEARRREHQQAVPLQLVQDVLLGDEVVGASGLLPPLGHEHRDGLVAAHSEPVHADLDPPAREHFLVTVAETKT